MLYKGHSNENRQINITQFIAKKNGYNRVPSIFIVVPPLPRVVHTVSNVPLRYKFLGRSLSCAASFTSSFDVKLLLFRAYLRGHENRWLPDLVIMGDGVILQFEMLNICFTV
jgi:hypothetical protein